MEGVPAGEGGSSARAICGRPRLDGNCHPIVGDHFWFYLDRRLDTGVRWTFILLELV